jgi:predicted membrane channel-forming protein YqfA (hemolysin III family)
VVSAGPYLVGALQLALVAVPLAFAAWKIRGAALPSWQGAPARLVEAITAVALLTWLMELLGVVGLLYAGTLIAASLLIASITAFLRAGGPDIGLSRRAGESMSGTGPARQDPLMHALMLGVIAIVVGHWAVTTHDALNRGIFNFDSLWYHMPFAADIAQSHSVTGLHYTETVFTNWFYPQNSELLHAAGILLTGRDTLSLFLNLGWLAVAFTAAYCIGRPYGRGPLSTVAAAILLECHTLVVREPGAAKNDVMAAALVLAAIAILVTAWNARSARSAPRASGAGWAVAAAGLAVGLAAGTKFTVLAMAAALSLAVVLLAPRGRRWAAADWWFLPALAGGGYWYLRNLVVAGNPLPEAESLGPISLPHPERLQEGRPDFSIVHYATDTGVWRHYFAPALHDAFGALWPVVLLAAVVGALVALVWGRDKALRWAGAVALFGMVAYLFTPLSAAGAEGEPTGFGINIRYAIGPLLAGIVLLPLPRFLDDRRRQWGLMAALLAVLVLTDRPDVPLRDPSRLFALLVVVLAVAVPALLWLARERGAGRGLVAAGAAVLALVVVAVGYPVQRHYLQQRFANEVAGERIPGMDLDSAYRWARDVSGARIGLAGTTAGFLEYGFFGTDLTNRVVYLGQKGPHGSYEPIPTCSAFRAAVNDADLDYLVTSPFLNFLQPGRPIASPEARWLRGEAAVRPVLREGRVTVWRVLGPLDPAGCGPRNAPLREIPGS